MRTFKLSTDESKLGNSYLLFTAQLQLTDSRMCKVHGLGFSDAEQEDPEHSSTWVFESSRGEVFSMYLRRGAWHVSGFDCSSAAIEDFLTFIRAI